MERLFSHGPDFDGRCGPVVIAIKATGEGRQHIGVVARQRDTGEQSFIHLAWHNQLRVEPVDSRYWFADPDLPHEDALQIAALCRRVAAGNRAGIPYGFSLFAGSIDFSSGAFRAGGSVIGLTCATFVLAVFDSAMGPLVQIDSWPSRPDDVAYQAWVINQMKSSGVAPADIEATASQVGNIRVRPPEVAAAAVVSGHPVAFSAVQPASERVLALLG